MKKLILFSLIFFLFFYPNFLFPQDREVVLDFIKVNGIVLEKEEQEILIFSQTDSISIFYHLETKDTTQRTPFIFRVLIKNSKDSSVYPTGLKVINYKNLPEDQYSLTINAFDPRNQWVAKPLKLEFTINNKLNSIVKELKKLKENQSALKQEERAEVKEEQMFFGFELRSLGIGFAFGFVLMLIFVPLLLKSRKNKTGKKDDEDRNKVILEKFKYEQLLLENSNLRAEISALRGQIDALNSRSEELRKQNIELKEKVEKLSNSKTELEELQQQKDELFALIIHDIKNPAALIKNLVELLRSYDLTASEQQEIIDDILVTSNRIVSLSQEVSRILALESSLMSLNLELGNINEVISEVVKANSFNAKNKHINIYLDLDDKIDDFKFDNYKLYEVLDNLISNAIKFTQKGGEVRITSQKQDEKVVIQVIDNGLGLSDEDISKAFQRGARLSAKPTGEESSSGLGLWIVKRLVDAMRGKVWVKSTLGRGSTFGFTIPIYKDISVNLEEKELEENK